MKLGTSNHQIDDDEVWHLIEETIDLNGQSTSLCLLVRMCFMSLDARYIDLLLCCTVSLYNDQRSL